MMVISRDRRAPAPISHGSLVKLRPLSLPHDLRPAFDGYFGIPQETRLSFSLLSDLESVSVTRLIHHPSQQLARGIKRGRRGAGTSGLLDAVETASRLAATTAPLDGPFRGVRRRLRRLFEFMSLQSRSMLRISIPIDEFDGTEFGEFLWQKLFAPSFPAAEFERCRTVPYATLSVPWQSMHETALFSWPRKYAAVDTSAYDMLLAQTPWPGTVHPRTQLIIRYHDAVPIFLPHTVSHPRWSQFLHLSPLKENIRDGAIFACVSEFTRASLLRIFPELEQRCFVVHNCIAADYFPAPAVPRTIRISSNRVSILRAREPCGATAIAHRLPECVNHKVTFISS